MLQIYVRDLNNALILPVTQGRLYGASENEGKVCIGDTSLCKYTLKHINTMIRISNITYGCETVISSILIKSESYKWRMRQIFKLKKLFHNDELKSLGKIFFLYEA